MTGQNAIGMVSRALQTMLLNELHYAITGKPLGDNEPAVAVTVQSPDQLKDGSNRINLFLYKVEENAYLKNADWVLDPNTPNQLKPPPLSLNLFYLMTAYAAAKNDADTGSLAHEILGAAMRVFHEKPIIPPDYMETGLKEPRETLRIVPHSMDPEELGRIWSTFGQPYRLSVLYHISTVQIDSARASKGFQRVRETHLDLEKSFPYKAPVVQEMPTLCGRPGQDRIGFSGQNLAGWKASIKIGDTSLADALELTADSFEFPVPAELQPGLYDVQVDIAGLFRRVFLFEVANDCSKSAAIRG